MATDEIAEKMREVLTDAASRPRSEESHKTIKSVRPVRIQCEPVPAGKGKKEDGMHDVEPGESIPADIDGAEYAELLSRLNLAIMVNDTSGRIYAVNRAFVDLLGYTEPEARLLNALEIVPARYHPDVKHYWREFSSETTRSFTGGRECLHKDGSKRWVQIHASAVVRGDATIVLTLFEDWSDHRWADPGFFTGADDRLLE